VDKTDRGRSDRSPLRFVKADFVGRSIIKFVVRGLMRRHNRLTITAHKEGRVGKGRGPRSPFFQFCHRSAARPRSYAHIVQIGFERCLAVENLVDRKAYARALK
jgi:hypothetical protein